MNVQTKGYRRLLATNGTQATAWITSGQVVDSTQLAGTLGVTTASKYLFSLGQTPFGKERCRGVEIMFFGSGAQDKIINFRVWRVKYCLNPHAHSSKSELAWRFDYVLSGTATLGTCALVQEADVDDDSDYPIDQSDLIADTISITLATTSTSPKGISGSLGPAGTGYNAPVPAAYSPADNTPAFLLIPDMGGGDLYLEMYATGGTAPTNWNALVEAFE